ncbi:MAG: nitroreductase family protein [Alistipes sp.]
MAEPVAAGRLPLHSGVQTDAPQYAEQGVDHFAGATAVLFIHAPKESRFGAEDANLAYQNASLTAESLGVSQVYMGFVLTAVRGTGKAAEPDAGLQDRPYLRRHGARHAAVPLSELHRPQRT